MGVLKRLIFSRLRNRVSTGKVGGLGLVLSFLVPTLSRLAAREGVELDPAAIEEALRNSWQFFVGLGLWGVRDAQDSVEN